MNLLQIDTAVDWQLYIYLLTAVGALGLLLSIYVPFRGFQTAVTNEASPRAAQQRCLVRQAISMTIVLILWVGIHLLLSHFRDQI